MHFQSTHSIRFSRCTGLTLCAALAATVALQACTAGQSAGTIDGATPANLNALAQLAGNQGAALRSAPVACDRVLLEKAERSAIGLANTQAGQDLSQSATWPPLVQSVDALLACERAASLPAPAPETKTPETKAPAPQPTPSEDPNQDCLLKCLNSPEQQKSVSPEDAAKHTIPEGVRPDPIAVCYAYCNIDEKAEFGGAVALGNIKAAHPACRDAADALDRANVQIQSTPVFQAFTQQPEWDVFVDTLKDAGNCGR